MSVSFDVRFCSTNIETIEQATITTLSPKYSNKGSLNSKGPVNVIIKTYIFKNLSRNIDNGVTKLKPLNFTIKPS